MKKKMMAVLTSLSMVFSAFAGISIGKGQVEAAVSVELPKIAGLYVSEYQDWDEHGKVRTDTDASGNTVLVDGNGEWIRYNDQDRPDYLIYGLEEGWGMGFENNDEKWFDYVEDGKVTHVDPSELTITHLDGTPCTHTTITAKESDPRVAVFHVGALEKVKLTYSKGKQNNAMIGEFELRTGFYATETMSLESQITNETNIVNGKTKEFYFHMTDGWEDAGFRFDPEKGVNIRYWDNEKEDNVWLSGDETKEFVTITPVSTDDPHHLVYKVTANGIRKADSDDFEIKLFFTRYNMKDESDSNEEDRSLNVRITEANSLYAAEWTNNLTVKGDRYVYPEDAYYTRGMYYAAGNESSPAYLQFKYTDDEGNLHPVTDLSKLTFWHGDYDEAQEKDVYTKLDASALKVEKAYPDSELIKISYPGEKPMERQGDFGNEYVITYDGAEPGNPENLIYVAFTQAKYNELSTYSSSEISEETFANEIKTDGTKDVDIYAASLDVSDVIFWNKLKSVEINEIHLTDENGKDLSSAVKRDDKVTLTDKGGRKVIFGEKITIPKGTLSASAKMKIDYTLRGTGGDGNDYEDHRTSNVFLFYSEPEKTTEEPGTETPGKTENTVKKGTKATVSGNVYTVTGKGTASFTTGKKNAKTVTVPDTVKIKGVSHKVTAVAANACKGNAKLTKLTIGKNVKTIGKNAFNGCKKLKTITIKSTVLTSIGSKAFTLVPKTAVTSVPKAKKKAYAKLLKKAGYKGKVK